MDKEQPDSMATVQMNKADYAASEVYSTASEPPPVSFHILIGLILGTSKVIGLKLSGFSCHRV